MKQALVRMDVCKEEEYQSIIKNHQNSLLRAREVNIFFEFFLELFPDVCKEKEYQFIIKTHQHSLASAGGTYFILIFSPLFPDVCKEKEYQSTIRNHPNSLLRTREVDFFRFFPHYFWTSVKNSSISL